MTLPLDPARVASMTADQFAREMKSREEDVQEAKEALEVLEANRPTFRAENGVAVASATSLGGLEFKSLSVLTPDSTGAFYHWLRRIVEGY